MSAIECPECGLLSPQGSLRCDCGYDFIRQIKSDTRLSGAHHERHLPGLLLPFDGVKFGRRIRSRLLLQLGCLVIVIILYVIKVLVEWMIS